MTTRYSEPTHELVVQFLSRGIDGPIVMLNLLRFRETADYSASPELAPAEPISGRAAYDLYEAHTRPFVEQVGGEITFLADGGHLVIGPPDERWDLVALVKHQSPQVFLSFASNEAYLSGLGHRTAALEDSRLLPLVERASSGTGG